MVLYGGYGYIRRLVGEFVAGCRSCRPGRVRWCGPKPQRSAMPRFPLGDLLGPGSRLVGLVFVGSVIWACTLIYFYVFLSTPRLNPVPLFLQQFPWALGPVVRFDPVNIFVGTRESLGTPEGTKLAELSVLHSPLLFMS